MRTDQVERIIRRRSMLETSRPGAYNTRVLPSSMTHKPKTLLFVGEDDRTREAFVSILKRDYRLLRAANAESALQMFVRKK